MRAENICILAACIIAAILGLGACAPAERRDQAVRTVEVAIPVLEERPVPDDLKRKPVADADMPEWVLPTYPGATSCLTAEGEAKKRMLDTGVVGKLDAWEKWGVLP